MKDKKQVIKKYIIIGVVALIIIVAVVVITQSSEWSKITFEAIVQETVTQPDGGNRLNEQQKFIVAL